jgi:phage gpG-like protein
MDIRFSIADKEVLSTLRGLARSGTPAQMRPVMKVIGGKLAESVRQRFETSTGPGGNRWKALAGSTVLARFQEGMSELGKSNFKKDGSLSKRGAEAKTRIAAASVKPLIHRGRLLKSVAFRVVNGGAAVDIGVKRTFDEERDVGAEVHQFGTRDGRIPARPFLGLSDSDKTTVLDTVARFLQGQLRP